MTEKIDNEENVDQFNKFLENNNDLLLEKYREYFVVDSLPIDSIDPNNIVKFINNIFSFDRYSQNEQQTQTKQKIESSLKENFKQFRKAYSNIKNFTSKVAIQLLQYCILNNQMFAVKYEKGYGRQKQIDENSPKFQEKQQKLNKNIIEGLNSSRMQIDSAADSNIKSNLTNQFAENGIKNLRNNSFIENEFQFHEDIKIDFDPVLIKKNTNVLFQYYCKQQMALKPNLSFERIQEESTTLTLSKYLLMARLMNMLNSVITKKLLIDKFREVSSGKNGINSKKFQILFNQLQVLDPTLVARSQLNSCNFINYLKSTKKPFDTQDINPRQMIKNRPFVKKLTIHSGKMQQDLIAQLKTRKSQMLYSQKYSRMKKYEQIIERTKSRYRNLDSEIITTKNLISGSRKLSSDLGVARHINIKGEQDDDKYLKEYRLKLPRPSRTKNISMHEKHERNSVIIKQLKTRIRELEKTEQQSSNMEETRPYLFSSKKF